MKLPAYTSAKDMIFGTALKPVTCGHQVVIGGGEVLPEVNFTLPPMPLRADTLAEVRERFREIVSRVLMRAVQLEQPALVLEFEHLFELTRNPEWGALITSDIKSIMGDFYTRYGLRTALRVTVADIRDMERPPRMRTGEPLALMLQAFQRCAESGADILSIESTGGKEVSDRALIEGDIVGLVWALGTLAPRDMQFLWRHIVEIARSCGVLPGGDTACGFANTAMQLANQGMIPRVLAAVVRLMSVPRSLMAVEEGAVGPLKDCGYENPIIKILTGVPISMEGKTSACAHSSPLGNLPAAICDLWSNESVQDVRLLGGFAPEVFAEMLIYDCRLMNTALNEGMGTALRDLFERSDCSGKPRHGGNGVDPQALVMELCVSEEAARRVSDTDNKNGSATIVLAEYAVEVINQAVHEGRASLSPREKKWLSSIKDKIELLSGKTDAVSEHIEQVYSDLFIPSEYGLS